MGTAVFELHEVKGDQLCEPLLVHAELICY
jgi:hypothetical protein